MTRSTLDEMLREMNNRRIDELLNPPPPAGPRKPVKVHGSWCPKSCEHRAD